MKTKWITVTLAGALLLSSVPLTSPPTAYAASLVGEIESTVSFRSGPSTGDSRIRYLKEGETVTILDQVNAYWYRIKDRYDKIGYTSTNEKYITVVGNAVDATASQTGMIVSSVSMRKGPSTAYARIRYAQKGETVTILSKPNRYWYEIKDKFGSIGYISTSSKYISTLYTPAEPAPAPTGPTAPNTGVIVSSVSLRKAPSTSSTRIRYVGKNEIVQILGKPSEYWYEVKDKLGNVGFVSSNAKYIAANYTPPKIDPADVPAAIASIISTGKSYLGTPYEYGSNRFNTSTFDCSDFVRTAYLEGAGITLPSDSRSQGEFVKDKGSTSTVWRDLRPGDILFFMSYEGSMASDYVGLDKSRQAITHNAIYLGNGQILHTYSKTSGGVRIDTIGDDHWEYRFLFGGSAL